MSEYSYPSFAEAVDAYKKRPPKEPKLKAILQSLETKPRPQGDERIRLFNKYNQKLDLIWLEMIECKNLPKNKALKILKGYGLNEKFKSYC